MTGFKVLQPGILTLIQDAGRFGCHNLGLTTGGPLDIEAFYWANRLLDNPLNCTALEISIGGLMMEAQVNTCLVVTGADIALKINGYQQETWHGHYIKAGDRIELGYATSGARAYLAVSGGFSIKPEFSSTSTVIREKIGGLKGDKLEQNDYLPCNQLDNRKALRLEQKFRPNYNNNQPLRVVLGYQHNNFSHYDKRLFFSSRYQVSNSADRMGYRLQGAAIKTSIQGILSEGICHGAIQIPADGQPIVLLNDRQTIGGYPKIGSVIAQDTALLAQKLPGAEVEFEEIELATAHNLLCIAQKKFEQTQPRLI